MVTSLSTSIYHLMSIKEDHSFIIQEKTLSYLDLGLDKGSS